MTEKKTQAWLNQAQSPPGCKTLHFGRVSPPLNHDAPSVSIAVVRCSLEILSEPPGELSLIPEPKLDDPWKLKRSLSKLLDYDFDVLLLCDGQPVPERRQLKIAEFLNGWDPSSHRGLTCRRKRSPKSGGFRFRPNQTGSRRRAAIY